MFFGFLASSFGYADLISYKNTTAKEKERISRHLTNMMGETIAVITAFVVINPPFDPDWVWWVLPTAFITPVIFWRNQKVFEMKFSKMKLEWLND